MFCKWSVTLRQDIKTLRETSAKYKKYYRMNILLTQLSTLPYIIGGSIMLYFHFNGLYWLISGLMMYFIRAVLDASVLLVEINR